ncbi:MAG: PD-(D/E)XK nuclease family protein [Oscillospiraceae bacterium]|nr:PD-(D/E)XK nuclease family protein [Oscillospiraceae bacterium]
MLQLIIGTAGTGKSVFIKEKIMENAAKGRKSVLIVPEQFSKTGEAEVFSALEKSQFGFVSVFSFTSLLRDVYTEQGMVMPQLLTDAGKAVMAQKAVQAVHRQLESYHNQHRNITFAYELSRIFEDFRRNGIAAENLYSVAQSAPKINSKLKDIALIYVQYTAAVQSGDCDLEQLYVQLGETLPVSYTDSTDYFVDGFESFSFGQFAVLSRIMEKADNLFVALTADRVFDNTNGLHPLSYTAKTAEKLLMHAKEKGVTAAPAIKMQTQHRFKTNSLESVDSYLLGRDIGNTEREKHKAFVTTFANQFAEVSFAAAQINRLVQQGYKYDDIAVVCPQLDRYEHQIQESFSLAGIPYFVDQNRIIVSSAPVVIFRSVLDIMQRGLKSDTVLPLLKTQLTCFDSEVCDLLENYLFVWQDQKLDWSKDFDLPYGGIAGQDSDKNAEILRDINVVASELRSIFAAEWQQERQATGAEILSAMYSIVCGLKCDEKLAEYIEKQSDKEKAELLVRQWDAAMECINGLYRICGSSIMRPAEMQELLMLMLQGTEIGFAPQTQDCVLVSDPKRMKTDAVKAVFVLGAAQDVFPAAVGEGGILSQADIQYLKTKDIEISAGFDQRYAFENLYYYKTLTTASNRLFISCASKNIDTQEILSAEVEALRAALNLPQAQLAREDYCITPQFFLQYIGETEGTAASQALQNLGIPQPLMGQRLFEVLPDNMEKMLGNSMVISPTASENYYKCAFGYFMRNILRINPLEKAQVSQREAGDYLHAVAQQVLESYGRDYGNTPWEEISGRTKEIVQNYLEQNYPQQVRETARFAALSSDMQQNALELLEYIHTEQQDSSFRPVAFEKRIAFDSDLKPVAISIGEGKKVSVAGVCDRIDIMEKDGKSYVRIVDYKTGTKKFVLEDVYNGLSGQLLLYMNSVMESDTFAQNPVAAAVMYQPSDAAFKFDEEGSLYMPTGMVLEDSDVCQGFDRENGGRYGLIKNDGKFKSVPGSVMVSEKMFDAVLGHTKDKIEEMARNVYGGHFDNIPMDLGAGQTSCQWCGYRIICRNFDRIKPRLPAEFNVKEEEKDE